MENHVYPRVIIIAILVQKHDVGDSGCGHQIQSCPTDVGCQAASFLPVGAHVYHAHQILRSMPFLLTHVLFDSLMKAL